MLMRLWEINIVEKNMLGLSTKYFAFNAIKYFLRARSSILILLETMKAISEAEITALAASRNINISNSFNMLSVVNENNDSTNVEKCVNNHR